MGGPGVLALGAVEVVAPERLLVASEAQPPFVDVAVNGDDATEEETLVSIRGRPSDHGRGRRGQVDVLLGGTIANGDGEKDGYARELDPGDRGFRHEPALSLKDLAVHPPGRCGCNVLRLAK